MSFLAYKGFDEDLTCRGFQYEIGKTYTMDGPPVLCKRGFHFCRKLIDVFGYYPRTVLLDDYLHMPYDDYLNLYPQRIKTDTRYCVVEVLGEIDWDPRGLDSKAVTNQIKIVRELTNKEIIDIGNKEHKEREAIAREILFGDGWNNYATTDVD